MEHGGFPGEEMMALPPGFRFHPTDEELITHYLSKKATDAGFVAGAIGEADLNKCEPWDLPWRAKMGEKEWYFFCVKDRKYPTGLRTNRATESGYWKATGKDKEIQRGKNLVGMKKTLVFYRGRAPKGEKTNWIMHEFRLEGKLSSLNLPKASKNEWVICRVFQKSGSGVKKTLIGSPVLPPLMDMAFVGKNRGSSAHVTCFSNAMEGHQGHEEELLAEGFNHHPAFFSSLDNPSSSTLQHSSYGSHGDLDFLGSLQCQGGSLVQLLESNGCGFETKQSCKTEMEMLSISDETGLTSDMNPEISSVISNHKILSHGHAAPLQLTGCLWN